MVICKHFQQGYCRFGSKCSYEHLDIKQLVKNDIEASINGKQYPFSCYGPFKDKPCVPNFIEDQSFEELRLLCLEARQKNCFEQFHQQFAMAVAQAMNKMKALLQPSYEVMNILTMIYDAQPTASSTAPSTNSNATNPFAANAQAGAGGGTGSIFGKASSAANGNVFSGNIFGGAGGNVNANNNAIQGGGIFGGQNNFGAQPQGSIFAQQPQKENAGSIFGSTAKSGLFNQQQNTTSTGGSGFFGQSGQQNALLLNQQAGMGQQQPQKQMMQSQQPSGIFGQNVFGQQQQQSIGNFGTSNPQTQNPFGQAAPMQAPVNTDIFAQGMQGFVQQTGQQQMGCQQQQQQMQPQQQQFIAQQPQDLTRNQMPQQTTQSSIDYSVYSKIENLNADDIEAFKADAFQPGKIPFSPPPIELLN